MLRSPFGHAVPPLLLPPPAFPQSGRAFPVAYRSFIAFRSAPFSPAAPNAANVTDAAAAGCPERGTLIRAYPARPVPARASRFAAARFARLIARVRPCARGGPPGAPLPSARAGGFGPSNRFPARKREKAAPEAAFLHRIVTQFFSGQAPGGRNLRLNSRNSLVPTRDKRVPAPPGPAIHCLAEPRGAAGRGVVQLGPAWQSRDCWAALCWRRVTDKPHSDNSTASSSLPLAIASDSRQLPFMATAFDTITAVRRLEDAGLSREAADAITAGDLEASGAGHDPLATKADLATLETRMLERMNALQLSVVGFVVAANALLLAAFKLIP